MSGWEDDEEAGQIIESPPSPVRAAEPAKETNSIWSAVSSTVDAPPAIRGAGWGDEPVESLQVVRRDERSQNYGRNHFSNNDRPHSSSWQQQESSSASSWNNNPTPAPLTETALVQASSGGGGSVWDLAPATNNTVMADGGWGVAATTQQPVNGLDSLAGAGWGEEPAAAASTTRQRFDSPSKPHNNFNNQQQPNFHQQSNQSNGPANVWEQQNKSNDMEIDRSNADSRGWPTASAAAVSAPAEGGWGNNDQSTGNNDDYQPMAEISTEPRTFNPQKIKVKAEGPQNLTMPETWQYIAKRMAATTITQVAIDRDVACISNLEAMRKKTTDENSLKALDITIDSIKLRMGVSQKAFEEQAAAIAAIFIPATTDSAESAIPDKLQDRLRKLEETLGIDDAATPVVPVSSAPVDPRKKPTIAKMTPLQAQLSQIPKLEKKIEEVRSQHTVTHSSLAQQVVDLRTMAERAHVGLSSHTQAIHQLSAVVFGGGATPMHGGATPGHAGGRSVRGQPADNNRGGNTPQNNGLTPQWGQTNDPQPQSAAWGDTSDGAGWAPPPGGAEPSTPPPAPLKPATAKVSTATADATDSETERPLPPPPPPRNNLGTSASSNTGEAPPPLIKRYVNAKITEFENFQKDRAERHKALLLKEVKSTEKSLWEKVKSIESDLANRIEAIDAKIQGDALPDGFLAVPTTSEQPEGTPDIDDITRGSFPRKRKTQDSAAEDAASMATVKELDNVRDDLQAVKKQLETLTIAQQQLTEYRDESKRLSQYWDQALPTVSLLADCLSDSFESKIRVNGN